MEPVIHARIMTSQSFEQAMNQIASQAEAQKQLELRVEERRKFRAKIRQICVFLLGAAAFGCALYFRRDVESYAAKLGGGPRFRSAALPPPR